MSKFLAGYYTYLQILVIAIFFYALTFLIFRFVYPSSLANFFLPDLYLPLQLTLFAGNFFFFTFLTQNRRWGLWFSLIICLWLFFKLQHFVFTLPLTVAWIATSIFLFCYLILMKKQK